MRWNDYYVLGCLLLQCVLVILSYLNYRRRKRELPALIAAELKTWWFVLGECWKVLGQHDDFNSRHVRGLIASLLHRYTNERREPVQTRAQRDG